MFIRDKYFHNISNYIDKPVIKVITGMRRSGKSHFLLQIIEKLKASGVKETHIVSINKESMKFDFIETYKDLYKYVETEFKGIKGKKYLFIDEIQEIAKWEKAVISFFTEGDIDIFITGSNAHLLSSELATLLSGRYIEFSMHTLSFKEYVEFHKIDKAKATDVLPTYLKYGGLPALLHFNNDDKTIYQYISSLYDTIILHDICNRHNIRNLHLLKNITRFAFDNIGNTFSAKSIADFLKKEKITIGIKTIQNYLEYLVAAFVLYKVERFDIKGKRLLEFHEKYYLGDIGLRHALIGYREHDISNYLENIVFLELKRRGYEIFIGKIDNQEIDFIITRANEKCYIQVATFLNRQKTIEREFTSLERIDDNYPKYVITLDTLMGKDFRGIKKLHLIDFLLQDNLP